MNQYFYIANLFKVSLWGHLHWIYNNRPPMRHPVAPMADQDLFIDIEMPIRHWRDGMTLRL